MPAEHIVSEPDVLIATTVFLLERGANPYAFSVATGKGVNTRSATKRLRDAFAPLGVTPQFSSRGADILAVSDTEWWVVECKGSGTGKPPTQRNNFDRALASAVSYFEDTPSIDTEDQKDRRVCLGLALPATPAYLAELRRRVRVPLRRRLNLWVLLYQLESRDIKAVAPDQPM